MSRKRKEQQQENEYLDFFLAFTSSVLNALAAGGEVVCQTEHRAALLFVSRRLARLGEGRGVSKKDQALAREVLEAPFLDVTGENRQINWTEVDVALLRGAYELVMKVRALGRKRAASLAKGRQRLAELLEASPEMVGKLAEVRAGNARVMQEKRSREDLARGGRKGGPARAASLNQEERKAIARRAGRSPKGKKTKPEDSG